MSLSFLWKLSCRITYDLMKYNMSLEKNNWLHYHEVLNVEGFYMSENMYCTFKIRFMLLCEICFLHYWDMLSPLLTSVITIYLHRSLQLFCNWSCVSEVICMRPTDGNNETHHLLISRTIATHRLSSKYCNLLHEFIWNHQWRCIVENP